MIKPTFPKHRRFTGDEIRAMRKNVYRMSRAEFGRFFPVSAATIKSWETGHRNPYGASGPRLQELKAYADHVMEERNKAISSKLDRIGIKKAPRLAGARG